MIIKKTHAIAGYVLLVVLLVAGAIYCFVGAADDVLFVDWLATATRAQVWLFLWGAVLAGVSGGRMVSGK